MKYLRIANPGIADPTALTIMGVGTTRNSGITGSIGMFGSGSKLAAGLLLRNELAPVIISDTLQLHYGIAPVKVKDQDFRQVTVKYKGTDHTGKNRSATEALGYTLEWGVADWHDLTMAPREYVANAIDGTLAQGLSLDQVEIELTNHIRAKSGWTQVYIPTNPEIFKFYTELDLRFLHFKNAALMGRKLLPKLVPGEAKIRIYKHGVLVAVLDGPSVWDYNLGEELTLDESRNASEWAVKHAIAGALAHADSGALAVVIKQVGTAPNKAALIETTLTGDYLKARYDGNKDGRKKNWQDAFRLVAGEDGVASSGLAGVASHLVNKGKLPFVLPGNWIEALEEMDVPTENKVLTASEKTGETYSDPTPDMVRAVDEVWELLKSFDMTMGKEKPPVKGFVQMMVAGGQKRGEYRDGTVLLHNDIGTMSSLLRKVALEEVVHHVTGAGDMSRDLQDFMFRLAVMMAW